MRAHLPRTLRFRLGVAVAALLASSFSLTFLAVYQDTGTTVRAQLERQLHGQLQAFVRALSGPRFQSFQAVQEAARTFVGDLPFTASSTLLFATAGRTVVATNQPELLSPSSLPDDGESGAVQLAENRVAAELLRGGPLRSRLDVPDLGPLLVERAVAQASVVAPVRGAGDDDPDGVVVHRYPILVGVGQSLTPVANAQAGVARAFLVAGGVVLGLSLVGAFLIGERFAGPLRRMAAVARSVDGGDLTPRIDNLGKPAEEVSVLASAFNHMLDRLTAAFDRQRAFIADASHELRTPLTVLRGQLELLLASSPDGEVRRVGRLMEAELLRVGRLVDDLLLLVKGERQELLERRPVSVGEWLEELWQGIVTLANRRFTVGEVPHGTLHADPDRLAQALRNLIVNGIAHTAEPDGQIRLTCRAFERGGEGWLELAVEDDGPGIPESEWELVFERFHRTDRGRDRASGGAGLGLAIVKAIVVGHGGTVRVERSSLGGARFVIELPGFTPQPAAVPQQQPLPRPA